ncbi:hypothetical protein L1987_03780 [Smallanthus sonchifolius]|uniref:Uncharacterized protein n=1 Tax=Smallanthus sonchifolius TaxID=185202 RepID=A0ACB9KBL6_9ASTR|nr:hypothetical protein L1987_03780 [Smallanthus sonchifolius]
MNFCLDSREFVSLHINEQQNVKQEAGQIKSMADHMEEAKEVPVSGSSNACGEFFDVTEPLDDEHDWILKSHKNVMCFAAETVADGVAGLGVGGIISAAVVVAEVASSMTRIVSLLTAFQGAHTCLFALSSENF